MIGAADEAEAFLTARNGSAGQQEYGGLDGHLAQLERQFFLPVFEIGNIADAFPKEVMRQRGQAVRQGGDQQSVLRADERCNKEREWQGGNKGDTKDEHEQEADAPGDRLMGFQESQEFIGRIIRLLVNGRR